MAIRDIFHIRSFGRPPRQPIDEEQLFFVRAMSHLVEGNPSLNARIHLLSVPPGAEGRARGFIAAQLDRMQLFAELDRHTYVLAMPTLSEEEAERRIGAITGCLAANAVKIPFADAARRWGRLAQEIQRPSCSP
ncbi:MAG TPA: hypothetical protein HPQ04_02675 [Rhodospirillaceae bacterium]|nr:hypothetical protein [Rhodospirillaceae bacterium]